MIIRIPVKQIMSRELLIQPDQKIEIDVGDMVEVVRCKECVYSYKVDSKEPKYDCRNVSRMGCVQWLSPDDFCSYAERRTDERG